jgi:hypothetical protein
MLPIPQPGPGFFLFAAAIILANSLIWLAKSSLQSLPRRAAAEIV